jgi:hypothetical protein
MPRRALPYLATPRQASLYERICRGGRHLITSCKVTGRHGRDAAGGSLPTLHGPGPSASGHAGPKRQATGARPPPARYGPACTLDGSGSRRGSVRACAGGAAGADAWWNALNDGEPRVLSAALKAAFADSPAPVVVVQASGARAALAVVLPGPQVLPE